MTRPAQRRPAANLVLLLVLLLPAGCVGPGGGYPGDGDIGGTYYDPYGTGYGGWGTGYRIGPFHDHGHAFGHGGSHPGGHAFRSGSGSQGIPTIPSGRGGRR